MENKLVSFSTLLILFLLQNTLWAQEATVVAGSNTKGEGGAVSYTVGQTVYTTNKAFNGSVAQGVQQAYEVSVITGIDEPGFNLELTAYPNPTTDYLNLLVKDVELKNLQYHLCDINGRLIEHKILTDNKTTISMVNLKASSYLIKIIKDNHPVKTFKIVKL